MLTKWKLLAALAVAASVLAAPLEQASATALRCYYRIYFSNIERRVPGAINTECSWPHTPPWGNWGVDSGYSSRQDGYQFAGWHLTTYGLRQWNSCTRRYRSASFLNDGSGQQADPDIAFNYASTQAGIEMKGCAVTWFHS